MICLSTWELYKIEHHLQVANGEYNVRRSLTITDSHHWLSSKRLFD